MRRPRLFALLSGVLLLSAFLVLLRGERPSSLSVPVDGPTSSNPARPAGALRGAAGGEGSMAEADAAPQEREESAQGVLVVRVVDAGGAPVEHAEMRLLPWTKEVRESARSLRGLSPEELRSLVEIPREQGPGEFSIEWRGPVFVTARTGSLAPGGTVVTEPPREGEVVLSLPPGASLGGGVMGTYADEPLLDVVVRARRDVALDVRTGIDPLAPERIAGMLWSWETRPGLDGRYSLTGLPAGRLAVQAFGRGRASERVSTLIPDVEEVWLQLYRSVDMKGRVVDGTTGRGVADVRVVALKRLNDVQFYEVQEAFSGDDGAFLLQGLRAGRNRPLPLRVQRDGFASAFVEVEAAIVEAGSEARIELWPACTVGGKVTVAGGKEPGEPCWVSLQDPHSGALVDFAQTDKKGSFTIAFARPGQRYDVVVSGDHQVSRRWQDFEVCAQDDLRFDIALRPVLEGRLLVDHPPLESPRLVVAYEDTFGVRLFERDVPVDPNTGEFRETTLTPGTYLVEAWAKGFAPLRVPAVHLPEDAEEPVRLDLTLVQGSTVVGRVVDRGSTAPVVGATIRLGRRRLNGSIEEWSDAGPHATSDGEGRFRLEGVPEGEGDHIVVTAPGYASASFRLSQASPGTGEGVVSVGDVGLDRAGRIEVEVVDGDGRRLLISDVWGHYVGEPPLSIHREGHGGLGVLEGLRPGRWDLSVVVLLGDLDRGFSRMAEVAAGEVRRETFRFAGATVRGRLKKGGRAVSTEYAVQAIPVDEPEGGTVSYVFSKADGSYELEAVPPGPSRIALEAGDLLGGLRLEKVVEVPPNGVLTVDFEVGSGEIAGRVVDADGNPLGDVRITASRRADERDGAFIRGVLKGRSGPDGRFELLGLEPGSYEVTFAREGFGAESREALVREGSEDPADLGDVALAPEARLRVETRSRAGAALAARVMVERSDHADFVQRTGRPPPDEAVGVWLFDALAPGRYRVRAEAEGYFPGEEIVDLVPDAQRHVAFTLRRLGALAVRTKGTSGALEGVPVSVVDEETGTDVSEWVRAELVVSSTGALVSGEDGWLRLDGLPEGRYTLRAGTAVRHVEVPAAAPGEEAPEATLFVGP